MLIVKWSFTSLFWNNKKMEITESKGLLDMCQNSFHSQSLYE
jgi:hypothetical protein